MTNGMLQLQLGEQLLPFNRSDAVDAVDEKFKGVHQPLQPVLTYIIR